MIKIINLKIKYLNEECCKLLDSGRIINLFLAF